MLYTISSQEDFKYYSFLKRDCVSGVVCSGLNLKPKTYFVIFICFVISNHSMLSFNCQPLAIPNVASDLSMEVGVKNHEISDQINYLSLFSLDLFRRSPRRYD